MTESVFYSDRAGQGIPRVNEIVSTGVWVGVTILIQQRINDGSLARAFPQYDCPDDPGRNTITGTDEDRFLQALKAHVPRLAGLTAAQDEERYADPDFGWRSSRAHPPELSGSPLDPGRTPDTNTALDVVDFVALHIDQPVHRSFHGWGFDHTHYSFQEPWHGTHFDGGLTPGQVRFQRDINLLFARNGIAFTVGDDLRVQRLGPPEARPLISDFTPCTGDSQLDEKLQDAMARFVSRNSADRRDALEKLWDAFERLKTLELGGGPNKKSSAEQLVTRAASDSEPFRELLDAEFKELTRIGNKFTIRHHEHDQDAIPTDSAIDYLFLRLSSVIALTLRTTARMAK
ncbi:hypothetical protein AB0B13_21425 [Streptomyces sp. NPDC042898]|uniref:hypothetical protein n=1 Tax=Streptomyces sp. NPDC042898 TaxID=3154334 RepID=UPI0033E44CAA